MKGNIRNYALYLEMDPDRAMTLYRQVRPEVEKSRPLTTVTTHRRLARRAIFAAHSAASRFIVSDIARLARDRALDAAKGETLWLPTRRSTLSSEYDQQELVNAVDQTQREIITRFDLKNTASELLLEKDLLTITAPAETQVAAIRDVLESKMVGRKLSLKILDFGKVEDAAGSTVRQKITLKKGINQDHAKVITKLIRDSFPKAKAQIQGDAVRVSSKSRDELQQIIQAIKAKEKDLPIALQVQNYRITARAPRWLHIVVTSTPAPRPEAPARWRGRDPPRRRPTRCAWPAFWPRHQSLFCCGWASYKLAATALFLLASLTDYLDGYLARRWHVVSRPGHLL